MARLHLLLLDRPTMRDELLVLTTIKHLAMLVNLLTAKITLILHFLTNNFDQRHTNTTQLSRSPIINLSNADSPRIHHRRRTCSQRFLKHQHRTHNLITARTALLPSYRSTRLPRQVAVSASVMLSNDKKLMVLFLTVRFTYVLEWHILAHADICIPFLIFSCTCTFWRKLVHTCAVYYYQLPDDIIVIAVIIFTPPPLAERRALFDARRWRRALYCYFCDGCCCRCAEWERGHGYG
jgi:hypothetical protein